MSYEHQLSSLLDAASIHISNLKPSEWYEKNMIMPLGSAFPGPYRYRKSPYLREILDCLSKDHPAHTIAVMKGAQIGVSSGVLTPAVGYIIAESPGNILFLTGHSDLSDEAVLKIDQMIDNCGIRPLIRPNILRAKNSRTGDTNKSKEFAGGSLVAGSATNHNLLRQRDIMYAIVDDFDAAKKSSKEAGSTIRLIEQRTAAYATKRKLFLISTPQIKHESNIEPAYLLGDQRKYKVPCQCCGTLIELVWETSIEGSDGKERAGIYYKLDDKNKLIESSVGYICQLCGGFFNDSNKQEFLEAGEWHPTEEAYQFGYYSYHISALYAPVGMFDWVHYARQFVEAHPVGNIRNEELYKTFLNLCLGETYEQVTETPQANLLQKNTRNYDPGTIPESLSIKDGNGNIVLLTCACDLNGIEEDARLDYEIVGWSETGASYSIKHGSIGTFIPREGKNKSIRDIWTYEHHRERSVWPVFSEIIKEVYKTDTGRNMKVSITGVDSGHYTNHAYSFLEKSNSYVVGIKGKDVAKYKREDIDLSLFSKSRERANLYLIEVGKVKDRLAKYMRLKWDQDNDSSQEDGFMNFPIPSGGMYLYNNFFSHFESEHKVPKKDTDGNVSYRWEKKGSQENHMFDVRIYNMALKDIIVSEIAKVYKLKELSWHDFVKVISKSK